MILMDDGFKLVENRHTVMRGDLVVYRKAKNGEINHVAIVWKIEYKFDIDATINIECLSQFGEGGEYFHPEDVVPQVYGPYREYWSERQGSAQ
jgi:hypothetical protein